MSVTKSTESILRGLLDLHGCAVPREAVDAVLPILQKRAAPRWQFGISQFSLAFDRYGPPTVRASAEVLTAAPAEPADAHALEAIGGDLFEALHRHHRVTYDTALFDDVVQLVHGSQMQRFRPPKLRFGAAVSWRAGRAPTVSCAFDLFAGGQFGAEDRLRRVVERLQAGQAWTDLARLLEDGEPLPSCRIVTIDFLPGGEHRARIDIMGAAYPLSRLRRLARACGGAAWADQLDLFNEHVLGGLDGDRTAPGLQLRLGLGGQSSGLMLIAPLPGRYPDDFATSGAVAALAGRLGIPLPGHGGALRLLAPDTPLAGLQRLQHSCSLALGEAPRLELRLLPLDCQSEHLSPDCRPRLKPSMLAELDAACRKAITALQRPDTPIGAEGALALLQAAAHGFTIDHDRITAALDSLAIGPGNTAASLLPLMQLALLAKAPEAGALCDDLLDLLFDPADDRADPAVTAEFAHALVLRGDIRSLHKARSAAMRLAARQDGDGLWQGDDDADRIRTSFLAVRVLCRLLPELPILARTAKGLRAAQAEDGSWGDAGVSARALAACALLHDLDPEGAPALASGLAHLLRSQDPDGSWAGDVATTAGCLESLIALRRLVEQGLAARSTGWRQRAPMLQTA